MKVPRRLWSLLPRFRSRAGDPSVSVAAGPGMDAAVVTCRRDLHLLSLMLDSYDAFSALDGDLLIFCDADDVAEVERMRLPTRTRIIPKQTIEELGQDDFRNMLFIKLNLDRFSDKRYIWSIDSDYLLVKPLASGDLFEDGRPLWLYRDWDNKASLRWRDGTAAVLGFEPPFQFMDRAQYVFDRQVLASLRTSVDLNILFSSPSPPSEYMLYAAFAYRNAYDSHRWLKPEDAESSTSFNVNQRAPGYCIIDPHARLAEAGSSKYVVIWSYWDLAEPKMRAFLSEARKAHGLPEPGPDEWYARTDVEEIARSGLLPIGYQHGDGWVMPFARFELDVPTSSVLRLRLDRPDASTAHSCRVTVNGRTAEVPLGSGMSDLPIPFGDAGTQRVELDFRGEVSVVGPWFWRQSVARFAGASLDRI